MYKSPEAVIEARIGPEANIWRSGLTVSDVSLYLPSLDPRLMRRNEQIWDLLCGEILFDNCMDINTKHDLPNI